MRLDLFLKITRLVKRRSLAQEICRAGRVRVRGSAAKPGQAVRVGDRIEIEFPSRVLELEVLEIPERKQVDKERARSIYEVLSERRIDQLSGELLADEEAAGSQGDERPATATDSIRRDAAGV